MSAETSPATPGRIAGVEVRSIDYVPLNERHGKVWSQGPLWFMSNAQIATLAVGTFSVTGGGNLIWSMLAIIAGVLFGTFFMAFHSAQGPQLGLPADDPVASAVRLRGRVAGLGVRLPAVRRLQHLQHDLGRRRPALDRSWPQQAVDRRRHRWSPRSWRWSGYDLIHGVERWLTAGFLVIFGLLTIAVCTLNFPAGLVRPRRLQVDAVPDPVRRGRRLPDQLGHLRFGLLALPSPVGHRPQDVPLDVLGLCARRDLADVPGCRAGRMGGSRTSTRSRRSRPPVITSSRASAAIALIFSTLGLISVTALNMYGGSLTLISAIDSFKKVRPTATRAHHHHQLHCGAVPHPGLAHRRELPHQLRGLPAAGALPVRPVDRGQPRRLLHRATWALRHRRDLQPPRHVRAVGLAGDHVVSRRVRGDASVPAAPASTPGSSRHKLNGADISMFIGLPVAGILYWCWPSRSTWRARRGSPRRRPTSWSGWPLLTSVPRRTEAV